MGGLGTQKRRDDSSEAMVALPTDGGWGWMVVLGSFLIHVVADGITYSFGVMIRELLDTFDEGKGFTSGIISILVAFTLSSGPVAGAITNRFGCRNATMLGAVIAAFGSFLSFFASGILYLYFSMGLITGIGFGLMYCPAIIVVTVYFEKKRAFATGIAVCGAGIGTFIFAPLTSYLLDRYLWRGTFLIYSGIILNCAVCGALFRDPPEGPAPLRKGPETASSLILDAIVEEDEASAVPPSYPAGCTSAPQTPKRAQNLLLQTLTRNGGEAVTNSADDVHRLKYSPGSKLLDDENNFISGSMNTRSLGKIPTDGDGNGDGRRRMGAAEGDSDSAPLAPRGGPGVGGSVRRRVISESHHGALKIGGVLSRKDLFYSASIEQLPEYRSNPDLFRSFPSLQQQRSFTQNSAVEAAPAEPTLTYLEEVWEDIKASVLQMADAGVLRDPLFLMFAISNFLTSLGMNTPLIFLPHKVELMGVKGEAWLLSLFGMANTLGRLAIGYAADRPWADRRLLYNTSLTLCGLGTIFSFLCFDFLTLAFYAAFFGLTLSAYVSLTSVILVDLLGLDKLTNAFGWILLFEGVASLVGAPIAGWIFDATRNYDLSFVFAGTAMALSGLMLYPLPLMKEKWRKKNAKKLNSRPSSKP